MNRIRLLGALSGIVWAAVAYFLGRPWLDPIIWGGIVVSPLIGAAMLFFSSRFARMNRWIWKALIALVSLYAAAILFGVGVGIAHLIHGTDSIPWAVVYDDVCGTLYGLTFTGYLLFLWPLAYFNHALIARAWPRR